MEAKTEAAGFNILSYSDRSVKFSHFPKKLGHTMSRYSFCWSRMYGETLYIFSNIISHQIYF